jgi:hypothetical protein
VDDLSEQMNARPPSIVQTTNRTEQLFPPVDMKVTINLVSVLPRTQKFSPLPANKTKSWRAKVGGWLSEFTLLLLPIKSFCINSSGVFLKIFPT